MSMDTRIREGFIRLAGLIKERGLRVGGTTGQVLAKKSNADYDVEWITPTAGSSGAAINDSTTSGSTTWSSSKTSSEIATARAAVKSEILGGAGTTVDTLKEIADLLAQSDIDDDAALAALTTAVGNRVRVDAGQSLTAPQQAQARTNIGAVSAADVGPTDTDYVALLDAALA